MIHTVALFVYATIALAQSQSSSGLIQSSKSPYELEQYIKSHASFNWEPLWKSLGVQVSPLPLEQSAECTTDLLTVLEPAQTILAIGGPWESAIYVRYFGSNSEGWRRGGAYTAYLTDYPRRHEL